MLLRRRGLYSKWRFRRMHVVIRVLDKMRLGDWRASNVGFHMRKEDEQCGYEKKCVELKGLSRVKFSF